MNAEQLNEAQQKAVQAGDGPVLIMAGPGTGKTKTLVARIAYLVDQGVKPDHILALTFTKKAAEEMKVRLNKILNTLSKVPSVLTFHALSHELLGGELSFVNEQQRLQIIKSLPRPADLSHAPVRELGLLISKAKNLAEDGVAVKKLTKAYNAALAEQGLLDFDDLLVKTRELLQDEAKRKTIQQRYRYILVDEFQDTNQLQYELLHLLRGHENIFVIGDPHQSIYGFRGAHGSIFEQFATDFPGHQAVNLNMNYRATPELVSLANELLGGQLTAHQQQPGQVRAVEVLNEYSEAEWVVGEIQKAIGGGDFLKAVSDDHRAKHRKLSDFAVLYRSRNAAIAVQKVIADSGLPYQVVGDGSPYEQAEVQMVIAILKALATGEELELEGFSKTQRKAIVELLQPTARLLPSALAERIIAILGLEPSQELAQLVGTLVRFDSLAAALRYFALIAEQGFYDPKADAITLLTIHASKGLEFPCVFLVGAEEGILPNARADLAEEKRLFYVAVTRSKERLDILHARNRGGQPSSPSRFITELPPEVLERLVDPDLQTQVRRIAKKAAKRSQQRLF